MAYNLFATDKQKNYPGVQGQARQDGQVYDGVNGADGSNGQGAVQSVVHAPVLQKSLPVVDTSDPSSGMNAISQMYTSPEQEEKMRKASVTNQRIMAVADALRHIGNIYNTVNYAPAQQLNSPVQEEQARYEKGKAVRDAANLKYYTYQQAKAAQEAKQRQWEADYGLKMADAARKAGYTEAQIKNMQDRLAQQRAYQEANIALGQRRADDLKAHNEATLKQREAYQNRMAGIAQQNANNNKRRTDAYVKQVSGRGGAGKGEKPIVIQGKTGTYKVSGWNDKTYKSFIDQAYYALSNMKGSDGKPMIDNAAVTGSFTGGLLGGRNINDSAKQEAVNNAVLKHPEAGDFIREVYGFDFESRPGYDDGSILQAPTQYNGTLFPTPWNTGGRSLGTGIGSNSNNNGGKKLGVGL